MHACADGSPVFFGYVLVFIDFFVLVRLFLFLSLLRFRPSQHLPKDDDPVYLVPMPKSKGDKSKNKPPSKVQLQIDTVH